jgi:hypothetical protein
VPDGIDPAMISNIMHATADCSASNARAHPDCGAFEKTAAAAAAFAPPRRATIARRGMLRIAASCSRP